MYPIIPHLPRLHCPLFRTYNSNKIGAVYTFSAGQLPFTNSYFTFQDVFVLAICSFGSYRPILQCEPHLAHGVRKGNEEKYIISYYYGYWLSLPFSGT